MGSDILGVSISGLRVSQNALRTISHNISNADTEGYSRQSTEINTAGGTSSGIGYLGNGAFTTKIERVVNDFIIAQTRQDTTLFNELDAYNNNILQFNELLSNQSSGLTEGLQSFFSVVQNVTDEPTSVASRQLFISESGNLADRFNTLYSRLDNINDGVNENLRVAINKVNNLVDNIAQLNRALADSSGASSDNPANDLLDQRDEALKQLSELVAVQVTAQDDNQVNVMIGHGLPLVLGFQTTPIRLGQNEFDPLRPEILMADAGISDPITSVFSSGEIGGLLHFKQTVIDPGFNDLGRIGLLVADNFNQLQQQGITLNNTFGNNIFVDINNAEISANRISPSAGNADANPGVSLSITDASQLTTSDYLLSIDTTSNVYRVTRLVDNIDVSSSIMPTNFPTSITFDGLSFDITSGHFASGDKFLIQPSRFGARDFSVQSLTPQDVALGSPILTDTSLGNLGNASISAGEVQSLVNSYGQMLPLFSQTGELSPPLIVKFTTSTTYDILDNSDIANPTQLVPPIRNQVYVPGIENNLFSRDIGETTVVSDGTVVGLPAGVKADLQPTTTAPTFAVTDFSGTANQFSFDVVVANTVGAANDGTFVVTINSAAVTNNTTLLSDINDDLAASRVRAYITDTGSLGFLSLDDGAGDITLQNYNADPDGGLDNAPAGQANALLGLMIESTTYTTVAGADGISGTGTTANDYPAETFTFTHTYLATGATTTQNVVSIASASARSTASLFDNIDGVSSTAFNYMELRDFSLSFTTPLQITLNGQDLVEYEGAALDSVVPSPNLNNGEDFNDYLVNRINNDSTLSNLGIYAVSAFDVVNNEFYIQVHSTQGDDLSVQLEATAGEIIEVNDGSNADIKLIGVGAGTTTDTVVGGKIDISLANNIVLTTTPTISGLFGDSSATTFARSSYLGLQANISGNPQQGDSFTIDFNTDAALDNRNGLAMVALQQQRTIENSGFSYNDAYNQLIETVGIKANTSQNSTDAAKHVLDQTIDLRNSVSGVNLDEEAADLIRFEQLYAANSQVIKVVREIFDRLLNSF
ncbi:flagellar hook-associated protein FlgK [Candidatus Endobugula sertula]|uniref:Flagellar hook-associated protein 1 n=1 Tax=Candidatus Endobugula sertula TaxID=62101 RepID=A0A1D2QQJ3_9GAMM|nr:flagellar hook-associated protein FlgK [Candidatus Endobugula sertula]